MKAFYELWNHYSSLNEMFQDALNVYRLAWLDRMLAAAPSAPQTKENGNG